MSESSQENAKPTVLSVSMFTHRLEGFFSRVPLLDAIGISGEITSWTKQASGSVNFSLSESGAKLDCYAAPNEARRFAAVKKGDNVIAYGQIRPYGPKSGYQLLCKSLDIEGIEGALFALYQAVKAKLSAEGLFEISRKRALPKFPRRVALVCAQRAKGGEDFSRRLLAGAPQVALRVIETRMQGAGAEHEIGRAISSAAALDFDLIIVARGGGSYEDLFPFNLESVVRAMAACRTPIATAIGHTTDHHLADDVADYSFATPSQAADAIISNWNDGRIRLQRGVERLQRHLDLHIAQARQGCEDAGRALHSASEGVMMRRRETLVAMQRRLERQNPSVQLGERRERFALLGARLNGYPVRALDAFRRELERDVERTQRAHAMVANDRRLRFDRDAARLDAVDPALPLTRGYAILVKGEHAVRSAEEVQPGELLQARLGRGTLTTRVEAVRHE